MSWIFLSYARLALVVGIGATPNEILYGGVLLVLALGGVYVLWKIRREQRRRVSKLGKKRSQQQGLTDSDKNDINETYPTG